MSHNASVPQPAVSDVKVSDVTNTSMSETVTVPTVVGPVQLTQQKYDISAGIVDASRDPTYDVNALYNVEQPQK